MSEWNYSGLIRHSLIPTSATNGDGIGRLEPYLVPGTTIALVDSSGVGKSTLINRLLDKHVQETSGTRDYNGKKCHTTIVRKLFILKGGPLMIDIPGLREVGIGTISTGIADTFPDIRELVKGFRFSDCRHVQEPGCAVRLAVIKGILPQRHLDNCIRLIKELASGREKSEIGLVRSKRKLGKALKVLARDLRTSKDRL